MGGRGQKLGIGEKWSGGMKDGTIIMFAPCVTFIGQKFVNSLFRNLREIFPEIHRLWVET